MVRAGVPCCLTRSMVLVKLPGFFFAFPSVSVASSEVQMYFAQPRGPGLSQCLQEDLMCTSGCPVLPRPHRLQN